MSTDMENGMNRRRRSIETYNSYQLTKIRNKKTCSHNFGTGYPRCGKCEYDAIKGMPLTEDEIKLQETCEHNYVRYHYEIGGGGLSLAVQRSIERCSICYKKKNPIKSFIGRLMNK